MQWPRITMTAMLNACTAATGGQNVKILGWALCSCAGEDDEDLSAICVDDHVILSIIFSK